MASLKISYITVGEQITVEQMIEKRIVMMVSRHDHEHRHHVLGNVVNSKNFLRTCKIMVMHSNEREEYRPRTLVDRKWKRYENAVDVVERLHDPTDPSTEHTAPPSSAHVQLNDVPRTLIQPSFEGEFHQHDGVVTVMMNLLAQGFT